MLEDGGKAYLRTHKDGIVMDNLRPMDYFI